jgi:hypothetical protein
MDLTAASAQETAAAPQKYVAYQAKPTMTAEERRALVESATHAGLEPIEDRALEQEGLLVFELPADHAVANSSIKLFRGLQRVPVNEYHGVLSVPTGSFYLRFDRKVSQAQARQRIQALGFKVITPPSDTSQLLVVEGTGQPADRDRELAILKRLQEILYVVPADLPLRVSKSLVK